MWRTGLFFASAWFLILSRSTRPVESSRIKSNQVESSRIKSSIRAFGAHLRTAEHEARTAETCRNVGNRGRENHRQSQQRAKWAYPRAKGIFAETPSRLAPSRLAPSRPLAPPRPKPPSGGYFTSFAAILAVSRRQPPPGAFRAT